MARISGTLLGPQEIRSIVRLRTRRLPCSGSGGVPAAFSGRSRPSRPRELAHTLDLPREFGVYFHRLSATPDLAESPPWQAHLDNEDASRLLLEGGFGSYVAAKPNRLVLIKGGTPHAIAKVRAAAGRHLRASIRGFFKKTSVRVDLPPARWTR